MLIRSLIKKGSSHESCQDALFSFENDDFVIACVCDGCSEVQNSEFASRLLTKILKKTVKDVLCAETIISQNESLEHTDDKLFFDTEKITKDILHHFFQLVKRTQVILELNSDDFSSTFIFLLYNKKINNGIVYAFGDGYLKINDLIVEINHNNEPKYFFHFWKDLTNPNFVEFSNYITSFEQSWKFSNLDNVIISTDGILTLKHKEKNSEEAIEFLVTDDAMNGKKIINQNSFFEKKYNMLCFFDSWQHNDDLGLIRIVKNES